MDKVIAQRNERLAGLELATQWNKRPPISGTISAVKDVWKRRELLGLLVQREIKARYKDSTLGLLWSLLKPIAQMLIYMLIIGKVLGAARGIPSFAVFIFTGLTLWGLFNDIVNDGTKAITENDGLVKKVYLPREIFPLSAIGSALFYFGTQLLILLAGTLLMREVPLHADLVYALGAMALILTFGLACALFLSAVNVYMRDFQHLMEVLMLFLFWASPIIYSYEYVERFLGKGFLLELYLANPVTLSITAFQKAFWVAGSESLFPPHLELRLLIATAVSALLVYLAHRQFVRLEGNFAQEL